MYFTWLFTDMFTVHSMIRIYHNLPVLLLDIRLQFGDIVNNLLIVYAQMHAFL